MWDGGPVRAGGLGTDLPPVPDIPPRSGADPHSLVAGDEGRSRRSAPRSCSRAAGCSRSVRPKACRTASYPY